MEKRWQKQSSLDREELCHDYSYGDRGRTWFWWNFWGGGGNHRAFKVFFDANC